MKNRITEIFIHTETYNYILAVITTAAMHATVILLFADMGWIFNYTSHGNTI